MIVVLIIGIILLFWGLYPLVSMLFYSPHRKAKIEKINVVVEQKQEARLYVFVDVFFVHVLYVYTVNGFEYSSKRVGILDGVKFQDKNKAEKFSDKIKGSKECFYSVKDPSRAHLMDSISVGDGVSTYSLIVSGFFLIIIYLFFLFNF